MNNQLIHKTPGPRYVIILIWVAHIKCTWRISKFKEQLCLGQNIGMGWCWREYKLKHTQKGKHEKIYIIISFFYTPFFYNGLATL